MKDSGDVTLVSAYQIGLIVMAIQTVEMGVMNHLCVVSRTVQFEECM